MTEPSKPNARFRIKGTEVYVEPFTSVLGNATGAGQAYDAAGKGRRAKNWLASSAGPKSSLTYALTTLRNRSRDAIRKNPFAESAIATLESNIVGKGITPLFKTPSTELNEQLAELFQDWSDEADADGRCSWEGLQRLTARGVAEGGEVFARHRVRRPGDMETVPLQIQLLEPEYCPTTENRQVPGGEVINGIEFDLIGRRRNYWLHRRHPQDVSILSRTGDFSAKPVRASEVSHVYTSRRPGDIRGEPWLTRGLIKMFDVDAYDDAEVMRKKTASLVAGFITTPEADGYDGATVDSSGVAEDTWEAGAMLNLKPGQEVEFSTPTDVGNTYEAFNRQQLRGIAVAAGILYEQLTGDYSKINDRTFRASVNEFRRRMEMLQQNLIIFQLCKPMMKRWLALAALSGQIVVPDSFGPRDLFRVDWMAQGWSYIHPVQEVEADIKLVRAGFKSRAQIVGERGSDVAEIDKQTAADNERSDGLGNVYDSDPRKVSVAGLTQARVAGSELPDTNIDDDDDGADERDDDPDSPDVGEETDTEQRDEELVDA